MRHKVIQNNLVLHHGEKNNSSNPFSYQENSSRQRTKRLKTLVSSSLQPWRSSTFFNSYINFQKRTRLAGIISCILLLALIAFAFHPVALETFPAEATANPSTTTLTVETSDSTATLDITPTSPTGTFSSSDTSGTSLAFNVSTNNITGYNLSISHADSTTPAPLTSEDLSEDLDSLPTGTSITESQFNSTDYVGRYGYKPSMLNSSSNSNYIPAPTTTSTTLNETKCANNTTSCNTTSDNYTIALGANIDYTKPAGTYTNTFILTAVANNVAYTINYLDNTGAGGTTGTDVSNLPDPETSSTATATNFTLSSTIPTRTGYTFAGWCYGTVTHNATGNDTCAPSSTSGSSAAGDGVTYQPDSTFSFANYTTSTNVANLYAMWNVKTYSLAVTFAGTGISSVQVRTASGTGGTLMGTVSASGGSVSGLTYGVSYYLYPSYTTGYTLSSWAKTDSATNSSLSSTSAANPTYKIGAGNGAVTITGKAQSYTCTKQYRLQNADGTYPSSYTADGTSSIAYGSTCSYTKSANYYTTQSTSCTMGTSGCTLSLDLPRTTYSLTVNRNTSYISSVSGAGTYRWGQVVSISATPGTGSAFNGWTVSSGSTGSFGDASSASTTYTMPQGASTIYANGKAKTFTITLSRSGGASGIVIDGTTYTGTSVTLTYGDHTISGTYDSNYEFSSWSTSNSTNLSIASTSSASTSITVHGAATLTLTGKSSKLYMQDMTASQCTTTAQTVYDKRDDQAYLVQQLADGKCWLLDNLRLGSAGFASGVTTLDSTNTNTTNSIATSTFTGWNKTSGFSSSNTPMINTASADTINSDSSENWGNGSHKYGVYYNYCAATMQSYCYNSGSGTGNVSQDVCPAGWRMPTGGSSGEYQALCDKIKGSSCGSSWSDNQAFRAALSTPLSGLFYSSSADGRGSYGYFWSSTYNDGNGMYRLYVNSSAVYPQSYGDRNLGFSVRCVLKSGTIADATNMQTVTSAEITNSAEGETTTLKDVRDNQDYTVAKINGNLWMTRNLAIGCNGSSRKTVTLTSVDSNVSSDYTLSSSAVPNFNSSNNSSTSGYTTAAMMCSSNSSYGAWYNYKAATAGTITGSSNSTDATKDICPAGWRLPTRSEQSGITSQATAFSPVTGGFYDSGSIDNTGNGYWWSATAYDSTRRDYLYWNGSSLNTGSLGNRYRGFYVRCIRSS